jgi:hypothetical protein
MLSARARQWRLRGRYSRALGRDVRRLKICLLEVFLIM